MKFLNVKLLITIGMAIPSIAAQQVAFIPEISDITPAIIPPKIPPKSNNVDKLAAFLADNVAKESK